MTTEFLFEGESYTLATQRELRMAILNGRCVGRKDGVSKYEYDGRFYLVSDHDLRAEPPKE